MGARVSRRRSDSTMLVLWSCAIAASLAASTASAQPGEGPPAWRAALFEYDRELTDDVRRTGAPILFQLAERDAYVSRSDTAVLMGAAAGRRERRFYDADHAMAVPKAIEDRLSWLAGELELAVNDAP